MNFEDTIEHMKIRLFSTLVFALLVLVIQAQSERLQYDVTGFNDEKIDAWKGGLANPQFSSIDLNLDGDEDLIIFDRRGDAMLCYLGASDGEEYGYVYDDSYVRQFPVLNDWVLLRDYNQDGAMDIFTQTPIPGIPGIAVYKGDISSGAYSWTLVEFPDASFDVLQIPAGGGTTNLYSSSIDIPAIADFDGDGDLDIAAFESSGGFIYYCKNFSVERGNNLTDLDYEIDDLCWGKVFESDFNQEISLSDDPNTCAMPFTGEDAEVQFRHAGSTLLAFDHDGDDLMDLLVGDLSSSQLILLDNKGTITNAHATSEELGFPQSAGSVTIPEFVSSFYVDINQDGRRDLLAAPNSESAEETIETCWYYENVGTDSDPEFGFRQKDLFVENMIDFGEDAAPVFVDFNADGLLDLVVGTSGTKRSDGNREPALYLLLNTGTEDAPTYQMVNDDLADMRRFMPNFFAYVPAFGDVDGDGDLDLFVGNNQGTVFYVQNDGGEGNPIEFGTTFPNYAGIDVNNFSTPTIADINDDGLMDIVIGERNGNNDSDGNRCGNLNYFENQGAIGAPNFDPDPRNLPNTNCLGNVLVERSEIFSYGASPKLVELGGNYHLFVGSDVGVIQHYTDIEGNAYGDFFMESAALSSIDEGFRTHVTIADVDQDGLLEMVVGNNRGGLSFFRIPVTSDGVVVGTRDENAALDLDIFPNPSNGSFTILTEDVLTYEIFSVGGRVITQGTVEPAESIDGLNPGIYILRLRNKEGAIQTEKIIIY